MKLTILALSLLLNFSLGIFVLLKNKKSAINILFFIFVSGAVFWGLAILYLLNWEVNLIIARLAFSFASIMLAGFLLFSITFPENHKKKFIFYLIGAIGLFYFAFPLVGDTVVKNISKINDFLIIDFGYLYWLYAIFPPLCIAISLVILIRKYLKFTSIYKLQLKYLFAGGALFLIPAVLTNLILPSIFNIWNLNSLGPAFSIFMIVATAYTIIRYHLMDIWIIIRKGTIFAILFGIIAFIFIFLSGLLERYASMSVGHIIPALIITIGFIPLKNSIELATDKIFFRKRYKFTKVISDIENVIRQSGLDLNTLLDGLHHVIKNSLRVNRATILLTTPTGHFISNSITDGATTQLDLKYDSQIVSHLESCTKTIIDKEDLKSRNHEELGITQDIKNKIIEELNQLGFTIAAPIKLNNKIIGIYLVGEKLSQDPFTEEDVSLLEHITSEMAFAIENARMYEELKTLDKSKSEFISVASHQLRTPLSIIKWNLELSEDKNTPQEQKNEILKNISDSIVSMGQQLDKLLIALEIEDRKNIFLDKKLSCLKILTEECLDEYNKALKEKNISCETVFPEILPSITYDLMKIKKSIDVLMQNAITYTPNGGKIIIEYKIKKIGEKDYAIYSISDNGIGINENDQSDIFKKFFRSEEARIISPNGFGLDLFIAKKYIEAHGGNLWFESSKKGRGVSFFFSIPL